MRVFTVLLLKVDDFKMGNEMVISEITVLKIR